MDSLKKATFTKVFVASAALLLLSSCRTSHRVEIPPYSPAPIMKPEAGEPIKWDSVSSNNELLINQTIKPIWTKQVMHLASTSASN